MATSAIIDAPVLQTYNDLPVDTRADMISLLNHRLADCIDLQTQTKQAHWNVRGPDFIALHKLFDEINEEVEDYVDLIAERAAQLGGNVEGTARVVAGRSALDEYPHGIHDGMRHVGERRRHRGHLHRDLTRHRQVAVVRGGARTGRTLDGRRVSSRRERDSWPSRKTRPMSGEGQ